MDDSAQQAENFSRLRHALRTPLNHIIGYAEMLAEDHSGHSTNAAVLRTIISEAQRICDVVQSLSGASAGEIETEIQKLRSGISGPAHRISQYARNLSGLDCADVDRIAKAASELTQFAESGSPATMPHSVKPGSSVPPRDHSAVDATLLVVDDNEGNRDILQRHLERQGYRVQQVASGHEALERLSQHPFDVVLLDLVMPGMDGFEVLDVLKNDPKLRNIPVLVISASDDLESVANSIQRGAEDYLLKPFDPVLLQARLAATLEKKLMRDREQSKNAEMERLTQALQRSNEDLRYFAYAASHDLQAPVRTITTYIQLLQRRLGKVIGDDERELFQFAEGAAVRMHALIRDLLQYSQATAHEIRLEIVDANKVVDLLLADMGSVIREAGASVTRDDLPRIWYDTTRLRQVLQNLIGNAVKYRRPEERPRVHISSSTYPREWRFSVQDNGEGVAPNYVGRIFEMFQRLHGEEVPGSGIGLALCKRLVERSGGSIWVDSEVDRGSTFSFSIPVPADSIPV